MLEKHLDVIYFDSNRKLHMNAREQKSGPKGQVYKMKHA